MMLNKSPRGKLLETFCNLEVVTVKIITHKLKQIKDLNCKNESFY